MSRRSERGVVLAMVLILVLLLASALFAFQRRTLVDVVVIKNRDWTAQAEALARGGIRLATTVLIDDLLRDAASGGGQPLDDAEDSGPRSMDTLADPWARIHEQEIVTEDGGRLRIRIEDAGARLNLNSLVGHGEAAGVGDEAAIDADVEEYLVEFFTKVIEELDIPPVEKVWNPREVAQNLIDYLDDDSVRLRGGPEDDYYARQDPPYAAANRPLLSVDELRLIEGFDETLVEALRPYVTVYPLVSGEDPEGVNVNTAPPWVLAAIQHGPSGSRRLLDEDRVRQILQLREQGRFLCDDSSSDPDRCETPANVNVEGGFYPPTRLPASASLFRVTATARVASVDRRAIAIVDRSNPQEPRLLSYRVQ
ncbi:MAG: type II secretion system minor pseudopilin GspK [Myxococcota bacterium]